MGEQGHVLAVEDLKTHYPIREGWLRREVGRVRAVDGVTFGVSAGEALGLVGESGSGKSTVARSILGLETPTDGEVRFHGRPVDALSGHERRSFRRRVQLIVQDPNEAFNPRMTIGEAVAEPLRLHGMADPERRRRIVADLLERVGLSATDAERYPHAFSGGEKQRIAIARALVVNPDVIIADEPVSALDSRVQADILALLDEIRREYEIAVIFISHDIDVVRLFCDRVAVMYLGELVEVGPIETVLEEPAHPYTRTLIRSIPSLDPRDRSLPRPLTESVPDPSDPPAGCRFHPRCPEVIPGETVSVSPAEWQTVVHVRFALEAGELPDGLADEDAAAIRRRLDIPAELSDDTIDRAIADAIEALAAGERDDAIDVLREAVRTPCEQTAPASIQDGATVACHRYDESMPGEPVPWSG